MAIMTSSTSIVFMSLGIFFFFCCLFCSHYSSNYWIKWHENLSFELTSWKIFWFYCIFLLWVLWMKIFIGFFEDTIWHFIIFWNFWRIFTINMIFCWKKAIFWQFVPSGNRTHVFTTWGCMFLSLTQRRLLRSLAEW